MRNIQDFFAEKFSLRRDMLIITTNIVSTNSDTSLVENMWAATNSLAESSPCAASSITLKVAPKCVCS